MAGDVPPPVADEGTSGAERNTEQCVALQASSATMFLTDYDSDNIFRCIVEQLARYIFCIIHFYHFLLQAVVLFYDSAIIIPY